MSASIAVLDANVLIPNALCDTLLRLAEADILMPKWSEQILDEVRRNLPNLRPEQIARRIASMNAAFDDAMVAGFEDLVGAMTNHPKDRHVLAAAVAADADLLITRNLRDFAPEHCLPLGVEAIHPDAFLLGIADREPRLLVRIIHEQAASTGRHGSALAPEDVLGYLAAAGAVTSAERIREIMKS